MGKSRIHPLPLNRRFDENIINFADHIHIYLTNLDIEKYSTIFAGNLRLLILHLVNIAVAEPAADYVHGQLRQHCLLNSLEAQWQKKGILDGRSY